MTNVIDSPYYCPGCSLTNKSPPQQTLPSLQAPIITPQQSPTLKLSDLVNKYKVDIPDSMYNRHGNLISSFSPSLQAPIITPQQSPTLKLSDLVNKYKVDIPDSMYNRHGNLISSFSPSMKFFEPLSKSKIDCVKLFLPKTKFRVKVYAGQITQTLTIDCPCLFVASSATLCDVYIINGEYVKLLELTTLNDDLTYELK